MRAAVYSRMSRRTYTTEDKIEEQERRGEQLVADRGWTYAGTFTDDAVSAWRKNAARPAFDRLLAACEAGDVDVIVVRKIDRLTRNPGDWGRLRASGVKFVEWGGSGSVLPNLVADIEASRAESESEEISQRVKWDEDRRVEAGKPPRGGIRAFGYRRDGTVDPAEKAIFVELVERYLAGEPIHSLSQWLHAEGIRTPAGNVWQPSVLSRALKSPRRAGLRIHRGEMHRGNWEPLISVETHQAIVAAGAGSTQRATRTRLLSGIIWCGHCGGRMRGLTSSGRHRLRYACYPQIGKPVTCATTITAVPTEKHVWSEAVGKAWELDDADRHEIEARAAAVRAELTEVEQDLARLNQDFRARKLSYDLWVEAAPALEDEAKALRARLREVQASEAALPEWLKLLMLEDDADDRRRQQAIRAVVRRVTIARATVRGHFDAGRITVEWRS